MTYRSYAALAATLSILAVGGTFDRATQADAANAKVCAMLSARELHGWWGKDMTVSTLPGIVDCQWVPADRSAGTLTVQIVSRRYYSEPKLGAGFSPLPGIGDRAYVVNELGGWNAGASKGAQAVVIRVNGGKTTRDTAITILKTLVRKL